MPKYTYSITSWKTVLRRTNGITVDSLVHPEGNGIWIESAMPPHLMAQRVEYGDDTYITEDEIRQQFPLVPLD